jgi:hypothetical protein
MTGVGAKCATPAPATSATIGGRDNALHVSRVVGAPDRRRSANGLYWSHLDASDQCDKHIGIAHEALVELTKHFDRRLYRARQ